MDSLYIDWCWIHVSMTSIRKVVPLWKLPSFQCREDEAIHHGSRGIRYLFNWRCLPYCTQSWKDSSAIFSSNMVMIVPMVVEIWLEATGCTIAEVAMVWLLRVVGRWCWVAKNVAGRDKNVAGRGYAHGVCKIFFVPGTQLELGRKLVGNALEYPKWVLKMGWGTQKSLPAEIA